MRNDALPIRWQAVLNGEEFPIFSEKGRRWGLLAQSPHPGFMPIRHGMYAYWPAEDEWLECVDYTHKGTYQGWSVVVSPNSIGTLVLYMDTGDPRFPETDAIAEAAGFEFREPSMWSKTVQPDDPDLEVVTTRTPIDPPWMTGNAQTQSS